MKPARYRAMLSLGRYEMRVIWNWPVIALSWLLTRYEGEWFLRVRLGPMKIEMLTDGWYMT